MNRKSLEKKKTLFITQLPLLFILNESNRVVAKLVEFITHKLYPLSLSQSLLFFSG